MFKYSINNSINGRSFRATFEDKSEGDAWRDTQIAKGSWGKPDRWERSVGEPESGYTSERSYSVEIQPEVFENRTEYFYPVEYVIVEENLSLNQEWIDSEVIRKRQVEYAAIDGLLKEALVEKELGNDAKWLEYVVLRQAIKEKHPKI